MSDNVIGFILAILTIAILICACRGLYEFCALASYKSQKSQDRKRNAIPDSVIEAGIRTALAGMMDRPEDWQTVIKESEARKAHYHNAGERIKRLDGKVEFKYFNGQYPEVVLEGIGSFGETELKPEVIDMIKASCGSFKQYVAVNSLLRPENITITNN